MKSSSLCTAAVIDGYRVRIISRLRVDAERKLVTESYACTRHRALRPTFSHPYARSGHESVSICYRSISGRRYAADHHVARIVVRSIIGQNERLNNSPSNNSIRLLSERILKYSTLAIDGFRGGSVLCLHGNASSPYSVSRISMKRSSAYILPEIGTW